MALPLGAQCEKPAALDTTIPSSDLPLVMRATLASFRTFPLLLRALRALLGVTAMRLPRTPASAVILERTLRFGARQSAPCALLGPTTHWPGLPRRNRVYHARLATLMKLKGSRCARDVLSVPSLIHSAPLSARHAAPERLVMQQD